MVREALQGSRSAPGARQPSGAQEGLLETLRCNCFENSSSSQVDGKTLTTPAMSHDSQLGASEEGQEARMCP
ncbi:hypothetical protein GRJ2_001596200 [Grus japonensis]|uniref:Uncharacterized protein n=1 Tax=Grus japonensis TaxID=30415 RepID=A0ABC9X0U2_GRUJA